MRSSLNYIEGLFRRALAEVDVRASMAAQLSCHEGVLRIGHLQYRLEEYEDIAVISIGKAAAPMAKALVETISPHLRATQALTGIVTAGVDPGDKLSRLRYHVGGHPTPDAQSRAAAEDILGLLRNCTEHSLVLFLISGGASSMVEKPLLDSISVADTAAFYKALVHSGLSIREINVVRKHFSAVKGGRLAQAAARATQCSLIISDVAEGMLDVVGSGPSMPDPSTLDDCRRILRESSIAPILPPSVLDLLSSPSLPETVKADASVFGRASHKCLLSNADLLRAAGSLAAADGFHVVIDNSCDDLVYEEAGAYLFDRIRALGARLGNVCLLSGGEISVRLPETVGVGGRNQQFALWCALELEVSREPIAVLSGGSDGLDGNSPAAGAFADSTTCAEARRRGLEAADFLRRFDSFTLFREIGAALIIGPTENNLRDLRILLSKS